MTGFCISIFWTLKSLIKYCKSIAWSRACHHTVPSNMLFMYYFLFLGWKTGPASDIYFMCEYSSRTLVEAQKTPAELHICPPHMTKRKIVPQRYKLTQTQPEWSPQNLPQHLNCPLFSLSQTHTFLPTPFNECAITPYLWCLSIPSHYLQYLSTVL